MDSSLATAAIISADETAPGAARALVSGLLEGLACVSDARLATSEAVSYAIVVGAASPTLTLDVTVANGEARIAVSYRRPNGLDRVEARPPSRPGLDELVGRSLRVIAALTSEWAVEEDGETSVWFTLPC